MTFRTIESDDNDVIILRKHWRNGEFFNFWWRAQIHAVTVCSETKVSSNPIIPIQKRLDWKLFTQEMVCDAFFTCRNLRWRTSAAGPICLTSDRPSSAGSSGNCCGYIPRSAVMISMNRPWINNDSLKFKPEKFQLDIPEFDQGSEFDIHERSKTGQAKDLDMAVG